MGEEAVKTSNDPSRPATPEARTEGAPAAVSNPDEPSAGIGVRTPEFSPLQDSGQRSADSSIQRFLDVNVTVSAELGRVTMPIADLLDLGEGSVVELNHSVTGMIDLVANGVRIARGEVVVVDDCFAIQIKQIETQGKRFA